MEFSCKMTTQVYLDYFKIAQKKLINFFKIIGIICIALGIVLLIDVFIDPINTTTEEIIDSIIYSVTLIVIGILLGFLYKKLLINSYIKQLNTNKFLHSNPVMTYVFNENNYKILTTSNLGIEECTYSYEMIHSAIETNKYIYVKISTNAAYIIIKSDILAEDLPKLQELLKSKLGLNYTIQNIN